MPYIQPARAYATLDARRRSVQVMIQLARQIGPHGGAASLIAGRLGHRTAQAQPSDG